MIVLRGCVVISSIGVCAVGINCIAWVYRCEQLYCKGVVRVCRWDQ